VYSRANSIEDCMMMTGFGVLGWVMNRYQWPAAPMILGLVLGPLFESALRQSLTLSHGSGVIFFVRPISAGILAVAAAAILLPPTFELIRRARAPAQA
jgi:putative tricarboxylic transport membrane protein